MKLFTSSGSTTAPETVNQSAVSGDFSLSVSPSSRTVLQGNPTTYSVSISRTGSFTGTISLSVAGLPSGASASFTSIVNNTSTLTVSTTATAATGSFSITVKGVNTCQTRSAAPVTLQIIGVPVQASYYVGSDQHVHEIALINNGLIDTDVSSLTGNIVVSSSAGLTSFKNGTSHTLYFVGADQDIHQLVWNAGVWTHTDLTSITGHLLAASNSALSCFRAPSGGINVFYIGATDHDLHQLNFNGSVWADGNLTVAGAGIQAVPTAGLSSFLAPSGGYNVFYVGVDQHVHQMNWNLSALHDASISSTAAVATSALSSFLAPSGGYNIFYIGADQDIHQINWNLTSLNDANITSLGHGTVPLTTTGLSSILASSGGYNIFFVGVDQQLHQLNWNLSSFVDGNLSAATNGPLVATSGGLSSFINVTSGAFNVYYLANGTQHVNQVNFNGTNSLTNADLTTLSNGIAAANGSPLTSFLQ